MQIKLIEKIVYGRPLYVPACALSSMIAEIIGRGSFSEKYLEIFKRHGYAVEFVQK